VEATPNRKQPVPVSYEQLALQWQPSRTGDRVFAISATIALLLALLLGALMSSIDVPQKTQLEKAAVPERVAQFIRQQQLPKPPPPPPPEPKPRPPESKPVEPKPETSPAPVRVERERPRPQQPLTEQQQQARDKAQRTGLLAHMNELQDLIDVPDVSAQVKSNLRNAEGAQAVGHDARVLTNNTTRGSGGVDAGQYATHAGSATLSAAEIASAQAALNASAEAFVKTDADTRDANPRTRSEEEVTLVFDRHKGQLQSIYNRARRSNLALKGKLVLAVTIEPDGSVSSVKVVSSELKDQALVDSLLARIRNFQFGAREVDRITVNYPIEFLPY